VSAGDAWPVTCRWNVLRVGRERVRERERERERKRKRERERERKREREREKEKEKIERRADRVHAGSRRVE
jgi:hypothetical protein